MANLRCAAFSLSSFFALASTSHSTSIQHGPSLTSPVADEAPDAYHSRHLNIANSVESIREEIRELIRNNSVLAPKFLRLAFHDCIGGCDGCVDMTEPGNDGLAIPMAALSGVVSKWKNSDISRADIWSLAAMVGAELTQASHDFRLDYVGRVDCEDTGRECLGKNFNRRECRQDLGDARSIPGTNLLVHEILDFFSDNFGFDAQETVALMGAHSIGTASQENSGFNGPVGWDNTNYFLDNDYYKMLIGGDPNKDDPKVLEDLIEFAPGWTQQSIVNGPGIPNRIQWTRGRTQDAARIISLNTDIGLARDLTGEIARNGNVSCNFKNPAPRCPVASQTLDWMTTYRYDEEKFLEDFENVLKKMIIAGYSETELTYVSPSLFPLALPKISVAQASYASGQSVKVTVENPNGDRVWIAIRRQDISPHNSTGSGNSEAWSYVCGSTTCIDQLLVSNSFDIDDIGDGLWRAYLMKDMTAPYKAIAFSTSFSVGSTFISSSRARYESGAVSLSFANIWSSRFWITVFRANSNPDNPQSGSPEAWAWPCGDQACNGDTMSSGEVTFNNIGDGVWRAFVMLDMYSPYESVAFSKTFAVGVVDQIFVDKDIYNVGDNVEVSFYNPTGARIWIGVYPASSDPSNLQQGSTAAWSWPCGTRTCTEQYLTDGTLSLSVIEGEWRVYIMRDMTYPYSSDTYSDLFIVSSLTSTPISKSPTAAPSQITITSPTYLPTKASTTSPTTSISKACFPLAKTIKLESAIGNSIAAFEIQAFSSGINVATSGTATQSSTFRNQFSAAKGIDGDEGTFFHTRNDSSPWWQVELPSVSAIQSIVILNRWCINSNDSKGCLCRLSDSKLSLLDQSGSIIAEKSINNTCGQLIVKLDFDATTNSCSGETPSPTPIGQGVPKARYLKLHSITGMPIHIREIEIYSLGGTNVALGKTAIQSSTLRSFLASHAIDGNTNSFSHTNDSSPVWEIDLGRVFFIDSIRIMNRYCGRDTSDPIGCLCRLSHAVLSIFGEDRQWIASTSIGNTCDKLEWMYSFSEYGSHGFGIDSLADSH